MTESVVNFNFMDLSPEEIQYIVNNRAKLQKEAKLARLNELETEVFKLREEIYGPSPSPAPVAGNFEPYFPNLEISVGGSLLSSPEAQEEFAKTFTNTVKERLENAGFVVETGKLTPAQELIKENGYSPLTPVQASLFSQEPELKQFSPEIKKLPERSYPTHYRIAGSGWKTLYTRTQVKGAGEPVDKQLFIVILKNNKPDKNPFCCYCAEDIRPGALYVHYTANPASPVRLTDTDVCFSTKCLIGTSENMELSVSLEGIDLAREVRAPRNYGSSGETRLAVGKALDSYRETAPGGKGVSTEKLIKKLPGISSKTVITNHLREMVAAGILEIAGHSGKYGLYRFTKPVDAEYISYSFLEVKS